MTGILVVIAVLWVLLNFLYAPSCGKFGCSYEPYWLSQAHAETGDGCPNSFREALNDEGWLRDRIESISGEDVTTGIVFDEDGEPTRFVSAQDEAAKVAVEVGHEVGAFPQPGSPIVVDHVEVKVAAAMRRGNVKKAILVINNPDGPCEPDETKPYTCINLVPKLLAAGAELSVFWEDAKGQLRSQRFVGEG